MATFTIIYNRIQVDWHAISFAVVGSIPGAVFGFRFVSFGGIFFDLCPGRPSFVLCAKENDLRELLDFFRCVLVDIEQGKETSDSSIHIELLCLERIHFTGYRICRRLIRFCYPLSGGAISGIFTAFAGSGVDICLFSIVTLLFR